MNQNDSEAEVISLNRERGQKFLNVLAKEPFLALVVSADGELQIFTKGIEPDHLEQIRNFLREIVEGD